MSIVPNILDQIIRDHVASMTSIRGRRVHRLLVREFSSFDHVVRAQAENGPAGLLALAADGRTAFCQSDGRGDAATVAAWTRLDGATVTTAFDLKKDSLPVLRWTLWHPAFAKSHGELTIDATALTSAEHETLARLLRKSGET